jgi:acetylornithine deacetylase/succinyl-diaminopimelate desuccinylase-like protein
LRPVSRQSLAPKRLAALRARLDAEFPRVLENLAQLARIPSVSYADDSQVSVGQSAEQVRQLVAATGVAFERLEIVRTDDGTRPGLPAVIARKDPGAGRPTIMLYAHHDVQPAGEPSGWDTDPWSPTVRDGRLYGRGVADDKAGVLAHVAALTVLGDELDVGISMYIDGEEEDGSWSFGSLLAEHRDVLAADALIVADCFNWSVDTPALVTSLRGTTTLIVEVRTLEHAVHSGQFGGPVPDAVGVLVRMLASLYRADGGIAVDGLVSDGSAGSFAYPQQRVRADAAILPGVSFAGDGDLASRLWFQPSITVIGIDAPPIAGSSNTLQPAARARLSMRTHPDQVPAVAGRLLREHILGHAPHGAVVSFLEEHHSAPYTVDTGNTYLAGYASALREGFGADPVLMGVGGSVPFIGTAVSQFPGMGVLLTGVSDPDSRPHSPNENLHLGQYYKSILSEIIFLASLGVS